MLPKTPMPICVHTTGCWSFPQQLHSSALVWFCCVELQQKGEKKGKENDEAGSSSSSSAILGLWSDPLTLRVQVLFSKASRCWVLQCQLYPGTATVASLGPNKNWKPLCCFALFLIFFLCIICRWRLVYLFIFLKLFLE